MGSGQHENKVRAPPDFFHSGHLEPALRDLRSEELEVGRTSSFHWLCFRSDNDRVQFSPDRVQFWNGGVQSVIGDLVST